MEEVHKTLLYIAYHLANQNQIITINSVKQSLEWLTGDTSNLERGMDWLADNGYFVMIGEREYLFSDIGEKEAFQINKNRAWEDFNRIISCGASSKAYLHYCEEITGYRMPFFNMMDKEQLDYLFNNIPISQSDTILDLGCGTGSILDHLVKNHSCRGVGIDHINEGIVRSCSPEISFFEDDLDNLRDYNTNPSITLAVDSLYFSNDLDGLLKLLNDIPNNRLYLYYSQYIFDEAKNDKIILNRDYTILAKSLQKNGISYRVIEYSANEHALYENSLKVLPKYKQTMESILYDKCWRESLGGKEFYEKGLASRHLYIIG